MCAIRGFGAGAGGVGLGPPQTGAGSHAFHVDIPALASDVAQPKGDGVGVGADAGEDAGCEVGVEGKVGGGIALWVCQVLVGCPD